MTPAQALRALAKRRVAIRQRLGLPIPEPTGHGDEGDESREATERQIVFATVEQLRAQLKEIDAALDRINDGTWGLCRECAEHIPEPRLRVVPWATLCVRCQRILEEDRPRDGRRRAIADDDDIEC